MADIDTRALFAETRFAGMAMRNRIVRSSTWDPLVEETRKVWDIVVSRYARVAAGGCGMIVAGGISVASEELLGYGSGSGGGRPDGSSLWARRRVEGLERIVGAVREHGPGCAIIAQLETGFIPAEPSPGPARDANDETRVLEGAEIEALADAFAAAVADMEAAGFDGVQIHAAHGGLLSRFLSPLYNARDDGYGGSAGRRARIVGLIVERSRKLVGSFPLIAKINCTDHMPGGTDGTNLPALALALQECGLDGLELSGGNYDCLSRSEEELGFPPKPAPESHTGLAKVGRRGYYRPYARLLKGTAGFRLPVMLVGGIKDAVMATDIVESGDADCVAMCRPLLREPDLPLRWRSGEGGPESACASCNACIYHIWHTGTAPEGKMATCVAMEDPTSMPAAMRWLDGWTTRKENP